MSDQGTPFEQVKLNGKPLKYCEMVLECNKGNYRLYVDKHPETSSFCSMAIEFASCTAGDDIWTSDNLMVNQLFNTTAHFDGVRHLEFNREDDEMAGYIYYPRISGLAELFTKLREIELEICRECDE